MPRLSSFLAGVLIGGALVFMALKYHVVRAADGHHVIPKVTAEFGDAYVDIRQFGGADWEAHPALATAIVKAEKNDLMQDAAAANLRQSLDNVLKTFRQRRE